GFQALCFAAFTKIFAVTEGLLPEDPRLDRAFKVLTLEVGLVIGFLLIALGLIGSVLALSAWSATDFGRLDYSRTLRLTIPAIVGLTLGCQTVFASFFLSVLGLRRR